MKALVALALVCSTAAAERVQHSPPVRPPPESSLSCDYEEHVHRSREAYDLGMFARSLAEAENALRCNPKREAVLRAAFAACKLGNTAKLERYVPRLGFVEKVQFLLRSTCSLTTSSASGR